jgi:hypothetical protein
MDKCGKDFDRFHNEIARLYTLLNSYGEEYQLPAKLKHCVLLNGLPDAYQPTIAVIEAQDYDYDKTVKTLKAWSNKITIGDEMSADAHFAAGKSKRSDNYHYNNKKHNYESKSDKYCAICDMSNHSTSECSFNSKTITADLVMWMPTLPNLATTLLTPTSPICLTWCLTQMTLTQMTLTRMTTRMMT